MTRTYHIVWNESMTEGFITSSLEDAKDCQDGLFTRPLCAAGMSFYAHYCDQCLPLETVTLPPVKS